MKRILNKNIKNEIKKIGFDSSYLNEAVFKHNFLSLKIYGLKPEAATIIKQTALSLGTDCAVNKGVLNCSIEKSDAILSGSIRQLRTIAEKLKSQPFSLKNVSDEIFNQIDIFLKENKKPLIMGILNITTDSFSDGGRYLNPNDAINHAHNLINDGADIIDIGAESTRPGAGVIMPDVEIQRISPVLKEIKKCFPNIKTSIDTRNSKTADAMLKLGADIINDVSGLDYDDNMANIIKDAGKKIVIMHSRGTPQNMDSLTNYTNAAEDIYIELYEKVQKAYNTGISKENIIIDPGFGFAKNETQNLELLKRIEEFKSMGLELLIGLSRKRFIKSVNPQLSADELDELSTAASFYCILKGVDIVRVHNVKKTKNVIDLYNALFL